MKLILLVLSSVIWASHQTELLSRVAQIYYNNTIQYFDGCLKENGVDKEMFDTFEHFGNVIPDQKFRCFIHCITMKPGVFNDQGVVFVDKLAEYLKITNQDLIKDIEAKCKFNKTIDKCYAAQDLIVCFVDSVLLTLFK